MAHPLREPLRALHDAIRERVVAACEETDPEALSQVAEEGPEDTIYEIDRVSESHLLEAAAEWLLVDGPILLVAEGLPAEGVPLPAGSTADEARHVVIVDPIDGTRCLMFQKRSAWILTGVAPNRGAGTGLADIELAVQTEIPTLKQHLCDQLWAERGRGAAAVRIDRLSGARTPLVLRPSRAESLANGFGQIARFFPGGREELAAIDDAIAAELLGPPAGRAQCFEDQWTSSAGQLYELVIGHDRFTADLRPLVSEARARRGESRLISCHPYDLCTELIAREVGVIVESPTSGRPLDAPLDLHTDVAWAGYANSQLRDRVAPVLRAELVRRGLLADA